MKTPVFQPDDSFACQRCGACCKWKGLVKVSDSEIDAVAGFLRIPVEEFIESHTRLAEDRSTLSLLEKEDGSCVYYDEENLACRINPVKPDQCRAFPHRWRFPGWEEKCEGGRLLKKRMNKNGCL